MTASSSPPSKAARLPWSLDPTGLQADLTRLGLDEWIAHLNTQIFSGPRSDVALQAVAGSENPMDAALQSARPDWSAFGPRPHRSRP